MFFIILSTTDKKKNTNLPMTGLIFSLNRQLNLNTVTLTKSDSSSSGCLFASQLLFCLGSSDAISFFGTKPPTVAPPPPMDGFLWWLAKLRSSRWLAELILEWVLGSLSIPRLVTWERRSPGRQVTDKKKWQSWECTQKLAKDVI